MNLHDWITIGIQLAVAGFVYGRLTERTKTNTEDIKTLVSSDTKHEGEIGFVYGHLRLPRH